MAPSKRPMLCGIDLGTTNSVIACIDDHGKALVIPNLDGSHVTPSALLFEKDHVVVGQVAKSAAVVAPDRVILSVKRHMGEEGWSRKFYGREYTPESISALILKKIVSDAERGTGRTVGPVIITVPAYFNEVERKATQDAGIIAGLEVISVLNEPTAAALAYGMDRTGRRRRVLVYDLGGGTLDVTIIQIEGTKFDVLATDGERKLGGVDWDDEIINFAAERFKTEHGVDPRSDLDSYQDLRTKAEDAKIALSKLDRIRILCQCQGKSSRIELSRDEFERMTRGLLQQTETYLEIVLRKAKTSWKEIDSVLLVGGMTRMPCVRAMIRRVTGHDPDTSVDPDECVALGAAYYNAVLTVRQAPEATIVESLARRPELIQYMDEEARARFQAVEVTNVNSHSLGILGIRKRDGRMINHVMIPKNTPIPVERTEPFGTASAKQSSVQIKVVEGEGDDPEDCIEIGTCVLTDLPQDRPAGALVDVTYRYRVDGRLEVTGRDRSSGRQATVEIQRKSGLSEKQVQIERGKITEIELE